MRKCSSILFFLLSLYCFAEEDQRIFVTTDCLDATYTTISAGYRGNRGMGYDEGYSTLALFMTPSWTNEVQPILDAKLHIFNDGYYASNLGGALRFGTSKDWGVFGINAFYDYRKWKGLETNQFGGGLELLMNVFSVRLNGYYPISSKFKHTPVTFSRLQGNSILLKQSCRYALPSADLELSASNFSGWKYADVYAAAGPYYLFKQNGNPVSIGNHLGIRTKLELIFKWFRVGGEYTYDKLYRSRGVGYASLVVPLGKREKKLRWAGAMKKDNPWCRPYRNQMAVKTQTIRRNEIIPMKNKTFEKDHRFYDASLFSINNVVFVNNQGPPLGLGVAAAGNGTFESPYTTLAQAEANSVARDAIYLYAGDGTTNGYDTGLVMKESQYFIGSGQELDFGFFILPAQTPGRDPVMTNNGFGIVLENGAFVNGINVQNTTRNSVIADSKTDFIVQKCKFISNSVDATVLLQNNSNNCAIQDNNFTTTNSTSTAIRLLDIVNQSGALGGKLSILRNTISGKSATSLNTGIAVDWENKISVFSPLVFVKNNVINQVANGCTLNSTTVAAPQATFANNTISSNQKGIYLKGRGTDFVATLNIEGNKLTPAGNAPEVGIDLDFDSLVDVRAGASVNVTNNAIGTSSSILYSGNEFNAVFAGASILRFFGNTTQNPHAISTINGPTDIVNLTIKNSGGSEAAFKSSNKEFNFTISGNVKYE
ncbi:MAG: hypothetical protein S4CHLAM37_14040 [Chlamydiia bacterium]|nr:hypothetical protein [Chlamydiia bacterium]